MDDDAMNIKQQEQQNDKQTTTTTILINNNHEEEEVYTTINNNNTTTTISDNEQQQQQQSINRNTWSRTSLRRSPIHNNNNNNGGGTGSGSIKRWGSFRTTNKRQLGSNALASELYRSSSFNCTSGSGGNVTTRTTNCNLDDRMSTTSKDDLYGCSSMTTTYSSMSDQDQDIIDHGSLLEDDVLDLNHKVEQLQQQVNILTSTTIEQQQHLNNNNKNINNNTNNNNNNIIDYDQYIKIKTENVTLKLRLDILEEQLHDQQTQQQSKINEMNQTIKDLKQQNEREKSLLYDNYYIKLQNQTQELQKLQENESRLNKLYTQLKLERTQLQNDLYELKTNNIELQTKLQLYKEHETIITTTTSNGINYFNKYQDSLLTIQELQDDLLQIKQQHTDYQTKLQELQEYIQKLHQDLQQEKLQNQYLNDLNIELQATIQLTNHLEKGQNLLNINKTIHNNHNNNNINNTCLADEFQQMSQIQLQHALKEQQDVNNELRAYIENILLNIVENSPQLLEVKNKQFNINNQIPSTTTTTATTTSL